MTNPNENCLDGMRCVNPECSDPYGPFDIQCTSTFAVYDDGTGDHEDVEWGDESVATCQHCQTITTVGRLKEAGAAEDDEG